MLLRVAAAASGRCAAAAPAAAASAAALCAAPARRSTARGAPARPALRPAWHAGQRRHAAAAAAAAAPSRGGARPPREAPPPTGGTEVLLSERDRVLRDLRQLCIRSSSVRADLKAIICESQDDIIINKVEYYFDNHHFTDKEYAALQAAAGDTDALLSAFYQCFANWFYKHEAPAYSDMRRPQEWYPKARFMRRRIFFHAGPTNSGKTHDSLERMMKARSGVYCAPLKLLAAQVWNKINANGIPCELVIGDEVIFNGSGDFVSCTVEMCPIDETIDVGVIDEIQMIGDRERGWAWTRALLGLPAREIHLCGEPRAIPIVKKLLRSTGEEDRLKILWHERLVPLKISEPLAGDYRRIERGDCVVCFSRKQVFKIKAQIEEAKPGLQVNIVYGALPHEVREAQTGEFNKVGEGANSVLVATDAIAFGLNLNIRRILFTTVQKFDGGDFQNLSNAHILQIGGRAGRAGCAFADMGYVSTLHNRDIAHVRKAFEQGAGELINRGGIIPTADILGVYWNLHQEITSFSQLLRMFIKEVETDENYFVCDMSRGMLPIADLMEGLDFPIQEKIVMSFVPWNDHSEEGMKLMRTWFETHAREQPCEVGFDPPEPGTPLGTLEQRFRWTECYGWLAMRFPHTFDRYDQAKAIKQHIVRIMKAELSRTDVDWTKVHQGAPQFSKDFVHDPMAKPIQDRRLVDVESETFQGGAMTGGDRRGRPGEREGQQGGGEAKRSAGAGPRR